MFAGVVAGALEAVVSMPFETTKIRQQTQVKHGKENFIGSMRAAMREDGGIKSLYKGVGVQVVQNAGKIGIRFGVYQGVNKITKGDKNWKAAGGFAAGICESVLWLAPCERIKILLIEKRSASHVFNALQKDGVFSIWTGTLPTAIRNGGTVGFRFLIFDAIRDKYCNGNATLAGFCTGLISTPLNNPIDVIKSEFQVRTGKYRYKSFLEGVKDIAQRKGWSHFFLGGLTARILKISLGQAVIFQTVDFVQKQSKNL